VRAYELRRAGKSLKLERIPMELLVLLVERRGELVARDQIIERIWGKDVFLDTDNSINAAIRKIRQVLKDDPDRPRFVVTITGKGYRFVAPVEEASPPSAAPSPSSGSEVVIPDGENLLGKKVSHYRILQILGGGGMGVVYMAEDLKLGRRVAMKFLPGELASDPTAFERLQREARAASALDHPNICSIYELGEHEGQPFIVMQLLEGQTLREWIESAVKPDAPSRVGNVLDLAIQIADGLEAAHQKGIIHRDIKPANIFVTRSGQAKILDFGVAKFVDAAELTEGKSGGIPRAFEGSRAGVMDAHLTRTGASMGTPSYLSPEQIRREKIDTRTDLFSFGLVLYEMATGQKAFSGSTATLIQEAVLHAAVMPARQVQPQVSHELESIIDRAIEKDRDLRYQTAGSIRADLRRLKKERNVGERIGHGNGADQGSVPLVAPAERQDTGASRGRRSWGWKRLAMVTGIVVGIVAAGALYIRARQRIRLTAEDTIVLGDFANSTGDPIFDDTLKEGLVVTLRQSPFLNILSESKIRKTLKLMTREPGTPLTPAIANEVCQRAGSKAYITGAIGSLGSEYVIGLKAVNCRSGDTLAQQQVTAASKERVLSALGDAAKKLRGELGESLNTVQKFDVPLVEATTSSLEALKAFSEGTKVWLQRGEPEGLPYLKRAVELDPKFALAYSALGTVYGNLGETGLSVESLSKAYELSDRVSERERLSIVGAYYQDVTGEVEKAIPIYEQWKRSYPSDATPRTNLGNIYGSLGRYEDALAQHREALHAEPNSVLIHVNLALVYVDLNRLDEAKATVEDAFTRKLDHAALHGLLMQIAEMRGDAATVQQQMSWAMGKPGVEDAFFAYNADIEASVGHFKKARESSRRAVDSAVRSGSKETAADWLVQGALDEAEAGNLKEASEQAEAALSLASHRGTQILAAMVFARAKKSNRAKALVEQLMNDSPLDTVVQHYWLPSIRAALELNDAHGPAALESLRPTSPYEWACPIPVSTLYPIYLRGEAFLQLHQGVEAVAEFRKVFSHPALTTYLMASTVSLELGRAYAMSGETAEAKKAYEDFLTRWKDADPDVPIMKQAKVEYAKLLQ
jgi:eukaryotic-like serine/threonine-protein kinase